MRQTPRGITIELSATELDQIERAARRTGASPADFVRESAIRATRSVDPSAHHHATGVDDADPRRAPTRRSVRRVIPTAPVPTGEVVRELSKHLGRQLLAITVDAAPAQVDDWVSGDVEPSPVHERRLREADEAWQLVMSVESIQTTRAWWMGMKEQLGDLSPAEAIAADQAAAVMSIARDFVEGG